MWKSKFAVFMLCVTLVASGLSYNLGRDRGYYEGYGKASSELQQKSETDNSQARISGVNDSSNSIPVVESSSSSSGSNVLNADSSGVSSPDSSSSRTADSDHFTGDYLYTTDRLNLREGPGKDYDVLTTIPFGEKVPCKSFSGSWVETSYKDQDGYVLFSYLSKTVPSSPESSNSHSSSVSHSQRETMVWISATGSKYHSRPDCGNMNPDRAYKETLSDAIDEGYTRCQNCY